MFSSWSPNRITEYDATFSTSVNYGLSVSSPADLDFADGRGELCIPNSGNNTVTIEILNDCAVGIEETVKAIEVYPNPVVNQLRVDVEGDFEYEILSIDGKRVRGGLSSSNSVNVSDISNGNYIIRISVSDAVLQSTFIKTTN